MIQNDREKTKHPCRRYGRQTVVGMASHGPMTASANLTVLVVGSVSTNLISDYPFFSCFFDLRALIESLIQSLNFSQGFLFRRLLS